MKTLAVKIRAARGMALKGRTGERGLAAAAGGRTSNIKPEQIGQCASDAALHRTSNVEVGKVGQRLVFLDAVGRSVVASVCGSMEEVEAAVLEWRWNAYVVDLRTLKVLAVYRGGVMRWPAEQGELFWE